MTSMSALPTSCNTLLSTAACCDAVSAVMLLLTQTQGLRKKADDAVSRARDDHERKLKALVDRVDKLTKEIKSMREAHTEEEAAAFKKTLDTIGQTGNVMGPFEYQFRRKTDCDNDNIIFHSV